MLLAPTPKMSRRQRLHMKRDRFWHQSGIIIEKESSFRESITVVMTTNIAKSTHMRASVEKGLVQAPEGVMTTKKVDHPRKTRKSGEEGVLHH